MTSGEDTPVKADVLIDHQVISDIAPSIDPGQLPVLDASGLIVMPGFVDICAHICQNFEEVGTAIEKGSKAAVKGGYTTICVMPDSSPPIDNEGMVNLIQMLADKKSCVKILPTACVTRGLEGKELTELGSLIEAGAVALYDANHSIQSALTLRRLMEYSKLFDTPLLLHCEDAKLREDGMFHEGTVCTKLGLPGFPSVSEEVIVARDILLSEYTRRAVHICHITTARSVELIRAAKQRGALVSASVTPHHLDLIDHDMKEFDSHFKILPPIRGADDRAALIKGLKDGTIDFVATDHTPCSPHEKEVEFHIARAGTVSLQTAFQVCYRRLVRTGEMSLKDLSRKLSREPLNLLLRDGGEIKTGAVADLVLVNPECREVKTLETFGFSYVNSPYIHSEFDSMIKSTIVNGEIRFVNGMHVPFDTGLKCIKEN